VTGETFLRAIIEQPQHDSVSDEAVRALVSCPRLRDLRGLHIGGIEGPDS
jgi:hypothetical protein